MDDGKRKAPPLNALRMELAREESRHELWKLLRAMIGSVTVAAALTVLVMTRCFQLLQVDGMSMAPTLEAGEMILLLRTKQIEKGDVVGFCYGGEVLLKRVIGSGGDSIHMDESGNVYVNGLMLEESYVEAKGPGRRELDFPYQAPEGMLFVLGDNREASIDSRIRALGCVSGSQIVGKAVCRVWPPARMGMMQ